MSKPKLSYLYLFALLTGCATSSDYNDRANRHETSAAYYNSIGQPYAAKEESEEARRDRDRANDVGAILAEIFQLFNGKS